MNTRTTAIIGLYLVFMLAHCIFTWQVQVYGKHSSNGSAKDTIITVYDEIGDSTAYTAMKRILIGVEPISYVSPLLLRFQPLDRILALRYGEGQKGYILEGWMDQSFNILQGRSQMDHFSQTLRVAGFLLHLYYGRDYLNIRYDDIVFTFMGGVSFNLKKYRHPRFNPNCYVKKEVDKARFEITREKKMRRC